jgi:hypothetical protein
MMFTDTQFMTAHDKELALKDWERFLGHGLRKAHFTRRLYEHLHLHCGFIAHYNIHGFYNEYFEAGQDMERFFEHFCSYTAQNFGAYAEYDDLNVAMRDAFDRHKASITHQAEEDVTRKIGILEASVRRAKEDRDFAKRFLGKINL